MIAFQKKNGIIPMTFTREAMNEKNTTIFSDGWFSYFWARKYGEC